MNINLNINRHINIMIYISINNHKVIYNDLIGSKIYIMFLLI